MLNPSGGEQLKLLIAGSHKCSFPPPLESGAFVAEVEVLITSADPVFQSSL